MPFSIKDPRFKLVELLLLFVVFPASFALDYALWIKMGIGITGFIYILWILFRFERISFLTLPNLNWKPFWKRVLLTFPWVIITTTLYVWYFDAPELFYVPFHRPILFVIILLVYSVFSVWPQEILYRTFFFKRYGFFFKNEKWLVFVNAILFSLAHLFFRNTLVIVLTFIGGLLFGFTYLKFKSTTLVTIEHALYGNWLFTVGMGSMLGFPT